MTLPTNIPAISGVDDASNVRVALVQGTQIVSAPALGIGLQPLVSGLSADTVFATTKVTAFTASDTFTPDAKMIVCDVEAWGGGGAGGGSPATAGGQASIGAGGNAGAKAAGRFTAAQIGASQSVTIGAGGTGVSGATGNDGGNTTLGSLLSAKGGEGGPASAASALSFVQPAAATQSATGTVCGWTHPGTAGNHGPGVTLVTCIGGQNELGGAIPSTLTATGTAANANTGAGGGGTTNGAGQVARTGGAGGSGFLIVREYLSL